MDPKTLATLAATIAGPLLLTLGLSLRRESGQRRLLLVAGTTSLGALASLLSWGLQKLIAHETGTTVPSRGHVDLVSVVFAFFVVAPLDQSLTALATLPVLRSRLWRSPYDTMRSASAAAVGFSLVPAFVHVSGARPTVLLLVRVLGSTAAHVVFASLWGYALGRSLRRRLGGTWFSRMFLVATGFTELIDHLFFSRGPAALVAVAPLLASAIGVALFARRDLRKMSKLPTRSSSRLLRVEPPSLEQIRDALSRKKRPVMIRWVVFGTFVTTGVLTSAIGAGIYIGHKTGVDFAAVDRGSAEGAISALVLLGAMALAAFPISGFLLAKASAAKGVLEPALGAALAIAGIVVLLGLAAPVAVVFALAFAPVAFALACAGAWVGIEP
jgi:RsiW-degrading membrane proteinase PrsW (M82 family)